MATWTTLYDVSRDGIGIAPWAFLLLWLGGLIVGVIVVAFSWLPGLTIVARRSTMDGMSLRNERPLVRGFLALWLLLWTTFGAFGLGNVFYQYFSNIRALRDGACVISEGPISRFHPDSLRGHGDHESFIVGGREFRYSYSNLGGGGLHYTGDLKLQLYDGLYVKIWSRNGIICRFDARPIQMKPQPGT